MTYGIPSTGYRPLSADGLNPMQIFRRVAARKRLLFAVAGVVFISLTAIIYRLQPLYTATAQIVIEAPPAPPTNPLEPASSQSADREKVLSEVQVLQSRGLVQKAAREFNLAGRPEYNPVLDQSTLSRIEVALGAKPSASEILDRFIKRLNVYQVGTSRVIAVEFTSADPALARDVANRVADLYIADQRQARLDLNARATGWLSEQIEDLRKRVADSEVKVEEFRAQSGLLEGNGVQVQSQQLSELNTQLSAARAARTDAEARAAALERLAASTGLPEQGAESDLQVLQSPLIQQLRQQESQLKRDITEMSAELLPSHPRMIQKQAELDNLEGQIHSEIEKVITSVRNEAQIAAGRERRLQSDLRQMEARRAAGDRDQVQLRALEREAAANRSVLESFLARYTEISARGDPSIQETSARIISRAETPDAPSFPQKGPMLVLAGMIAFVTGLAAIFFAELGNRRIRHMNDIESASGVPVLAALPSVAEPQEEAMRRPAGAFADGLRLLHAGLGIVPASGNRRGRVIVVTSTSRGEGRTTTALALARSMAQGGLRVLLIDADFQHPDIAAKIGRSLPWGFRDLLAGRAGFSNVIVRDPVSSAQIVSAGHAYRQSLVASSRLRPVMLGLVHAYDAVVIDCEPVSSHDAQFLMRLADQCVYAVRWNATERDRVLAGVRHVSVSRGRDGGIGLVLTGADLSAAA